MPFLERLHFHFLIILQFLGNGIFPSYSAHICNAPLSHQIDIQYAQGLMSLVSEIGKIDIQ